MVPVGQKTYTVRYEVDTEGTVDLYVRTPETGDSALIVPTLTLNIGELLLPVGEAIDLDTGERGYNPDGVFYEPCKEIGTKSFSDKELQEIFDKIREIGFLNLVNK